MILIGLFGIQVVNNLIVVICDIAIVIFVVYNYILMMILHAWLIDLHKLWPTLVVFVAEYGRNRLICMQVLLAVSTLNATIRRDMQELSRALVKEMADFTRISSWQDVSIINSGG